MNHGLKCTYKIVTAAIQIRSKLVREEVPFVLHALGMGLHE